MGQSKRSIVSLNQWLMTGVCAGRQTRQVIDVGAHVGQFAKGLRRAGYTGEILSIEPLSDAHKRLSAAAEADPMWRVAPRLAAGRDAGEAIINIAGNSYSSSLLPMLERHETAAPGSGYVGQETVEIAALDQIIEDNIPDRDSRLAVKIDTQGHEGVVLDGLERNRQRVECFLVELSFVPLYEGGVTFREIVSRLWRDGFKCLSLTPVFLDPSSWMRMAKCCRLTASSSAKGR